jgi:predicted ATPase
MARKPRSTPGPYLIHAELLRDRVPSFDKYPFRLPAVRTLDKLPFHPKVTFLVGENGSGKSTLLEAVAVGCGLNPEGGSRNFNFATRASHSELERYLRIARTSTPNDAFFLRAESYFNVATEIESLDTDPPDAYFRPRKIIESFGRVSLHEQSHGESFFALFRYRLEGPGLYFLDEPEAALSPRRQMEFLVLLHERCKAGSQFVIATHSPILMAYPDAWIYALGPTGPERVAYTDTDHYLVTRGFLTSPKKMLAELLSDDSPAGGDPVT